MIVLNRLILSISACLVLESTYISSNTPQSVYHIHPNYGPTLSLTPVIYSCAQFTIIFCWAFFIPFRMSNHGGSLQELFHLRSIYYQNNPATWFIRTGHPAWGIRDIPRSLQVLAHFWESGLLFVAMLPHLQPPLVWSGNISGNVTVVSGLAAQITWNG